VFLSKKNADVDVPPEGEAHDEASAQPQSEWAEEGDDSSPADAPDDLTETERAEESVDSSPADAPDDLTEEPSDVPEMSSPDEGNPDQPGGDEATKLVIGREISLNGEINSCDLLVVEGKVEATMKECREIRITETGTFKGQVEFERADISGVFEGDLTAREHLVVRATGRVTGKVRFGELEIERGGQILGDIQVFSNGTAAEQEAQGAVEKLAN